jgi:hypothetical protein
MGKNRSKYGNIKVDGKDSKLERNHGLELELLQKKGIIKDLKEQYKVNIEVYNPKTKAWERLSRRYCKIDYCFTVNGKTVLLDSKGYSNSKTAQSVNYQVLEYMIEAGRLPNHKFIVEKASSINIKQLLDL